MMHLVTLSTKGQIVIPAEIRRELGFSSGLKMRIYAHGRRIVLIPDEEDPIAAGMGFLSNRAGLSPADLAVPARTLAPAGEPNENLPAVQEEEGGLV